MDEIYKEVALFFRPITAENIALINGCFCEEDGFMPNKKAIQEIEPKLFTAYKYHFLDKVQHKNHVNNEVVQQLIIEVAAIIAFYIASTQMFPTANKRTAAEAVFLLLDANGLSLNYKEVSDGGSNELAEMLQNIGSNDLNKEQTIAWFKSHCERG